MPVTAPVCAKCAANGMWYQRLSKLNIPAPSALAVCTHHCAATTTTATSVAAVVGSRALIQSGGFSDADREPIAGGEGAGEPRQTITAMSTRAGIRAADR